MLFDKDDVANFRQGGRIRISWQVFDGNVFDGNSVYFESDVEGDASEFADMIELYLINQRTLGNIE
jgi:hypothetical protein